MSCKTLRVQKLYTKVKVPKKVPKKVPRLFKLSYLLQITHTNGTCKRFARSTTDAEGIKLADLVQLYLQPLKTQLLIWRHLKTWHLFIFAPLIFDTLKSPVIDQKLWLYGSSWTAPRATPSNCNDLQSVPKLNKFGRKWANCWHFMLSDKK